MSEIIDFNRPSEPPVDTYSVKYLDIVYDSNREESVERSVETEVQGFVAFGPHYVAVSVDESAANFIVPMSRLVSITKVQTDGAQATTTPKGSSIQ